MSSEIKIWWEEFHAPFVMDDFLIDCQAEDLAFADLLGIECTSSFSCAFSRMCIWMMNGLIQMQEFEDACDNFREVTGYKGYFPWEIQEILT